MASNDSLLIYNFFLVEWHPTKNRIVVIPIISSRITPNFNFPEATTTQTLKGTWELVAATIVDYHVDEIEVP